ncbi:MAG: hypothetical protein Q7U02_07370 [Desulfosalsimonadaceae bacterium]|nr:hypothetical protein [Desulfosalsimonadaceae bacterium]
MNRKITITLLSLLILLMPLCAFGVTFPDKPPSEHYYVDDAGLLWRGDQEFPARAVIGIDDRAHFHLDLASIFALTNILVYRLCEVV